MSFTLYSRTQEYKSLTDIQPVPLQRLYDYWKGAQFDQDVPRQRDVSPAKVPECMGNIALVGLELKPARARYIIVGRNLKRLLGRDPTGMTVEQAYSKSVAREVYAAFGKTVRSRAATFYKREYNILGQRFGYYRLILPLRLEDTRVSRLLIGIYPTDDRVTDAKPWQRALKKLTNSQGEAAPDTVEDLDRAWDGSMHEDETSKP